MFYVNGFAYVCISQHPIKGNATARGAIGVDSILA